MNRDNERRAREPFEHLMAKQRQRRRDLFGHFDGLPRFADDDDRAKDPPTPTTKEDR